MNRKTRPPLVLVMILALFYTSTLDAGIPSKYAGLDSNMETAYISIFSLPDKSRAILRKYFPNIQLELGEVPAPYHHVGRDTLLS